MGVVRKEVVLTDPANASLGFQLHFTDVFLEEVAKVGGEDLPAKVVGKLVQPWVELVATSTDLRLIEHTVENQLGHDLEINSTLVKKNSERKEKKRKHDAPITNGHSSDAPITNGHSSPVKKAKIEDGESNGEVKAMDINQNLPEQTKKKKKKKNKEKSNGISEAKEGVKKVEEKETNDSKKMSNSLLEEVPAKEASQLIFKSDSLVEAVDVKSEMKNVQVEEAGQILDAEKKLKKKKKKLKKEMHRIDSDISFNAPSLSKTNLSLPEKPTPAPMTPITEADTPTPVTPTAESPKSTPMLESEANPSSEETPKLKKKKMKKSAKKLNPVGLNTQLNSRSKTAKILQKRA